ncbi:transposase [Massilia frigida]|uniref:transposase n=1 Tax=Massilia frigida TaxID=2609281 RepID=UPI00351D3935
MESRERLGRWRWVVERTLGWIHRFRRLRIRHARRAGIHQAFLSLACSLICWRYAERVLLGALKHRLFRAGGNDGFEVGCRKAA